MKAWIVLLLADCAIAGTGLTYLTSLKLRVEERIAYGAIIGFMALTLVGYAASWAVGGLSGGVVIGVAIAVAAVSAPGWWTGIRQFGPECRDFRRRLMRPISRGDNPAPLLMLAAPAWALTVWILNQAYLPDGEGGVRAGHLASWTDWQAHLIYASSFAHAENFPPELPTAFGIDRLPYHFGVDFFAAMLDRAGLSAFGGLEVSSGYLAFAFVPVLYLAGVRLFSSRAIGVLAVLVFTLFGGLGWLRFFGDVAADGWSVIWDLPTDYTRHYPGNIVMENPVTGVLFPQRPTLAGFSLLLVVVVLLREGHKTKSPRLFAAAGLIVGLMPVFHVYSFAAALGLGLVWAAMAPRWQWILFALPALVFALPAVIWIEPLNTSVVVETWVSGPWMQPPTYSVNQDSLLSFWWRNAGLFLVLMLAAQVWKGTLPRIVLWGSIPVWLWLIVPNFARVAPSHPWNNTHWFVLVILLGSLLVAAVLVRLGAAGWWGKVGASVLFFALTFAGALDIWKAVDPEVNAWPQPIASGDGVAAGEWARDHTPTDSVFLLGFEHTHPVPALSGRQTVVSFAGWINDQGVTDWSSRQQLAWDMLLGVGPAEELLDRYGVDYVVVGPVERRIGVEDEFWATRGELEFSDGDYRIYKVD